MTRGRRAGTLGLVALAVAVPAAAPRAQGNDPALLQRVLQQLAPAQRASGAGTGAQGPQTALQPALAWAIEQLDPASFAVLRAVPVAGHGPVLQTGDVFVLQFSTNLPGQVRLEGLDAQGRSADLGQYTVWPEQPNRLPRDRGIQLQGEPGEERLRFYFFPCLPEGSGGQPWAGALQGRLPACPRTGAAAPEAAGSSAAPGRSWGTISPRALVPMNQPDQHLALAGSRDWRPGDVTLMEARIRHEGRAQHRR